MNEDVKRRIDKAEKELNEVFYNLLYEHGDNDGHRELDDPSSGFRTLLRYARKWQRRETDGERKAKGKESRYAIAFDADKEFKGIRMMDGPSEPSEAGQGSVYVFSQKEFKRPMESAMRRLRFGLGDLCDRVAANGGAVHCVGDAFGGGAKRAKAKEGKRE